jgi:hypothetical protein
MAATGEIKREARAADQCENSQIAPFPLAFPLVKNSACTGADRCRRTSLLSENLPEKLLQFSPGSRICFGVISQGRIALLICFRVGEAVYYAAI